MLLIKKEFNVEGMSCNHCVNAIKNALMKLDGINNVEISLEKKIVMVEYEEGKVDETLIASTIEEQGYDVV